MPFESTTLTIIALPAATSALYWLDVRLPLALKVYPITVRGIIIVDGLELETTDAELILAAPSAVIKVEPDPKFPVQFPVVSDAMAPVTYDDDAVVKVVVSEEVPGADEPLPPQATRAKAQLPAKALKNLIRKIPLSVLKFYKIGRLISSYLQF